MSAEGKTDEGLSLIMGRKPRVLAADDDRFHLKICADLVEGLGYECLCVENGLEALEKAREYGPDIIILDVVMPGMDGFEATRRLKLDPMTATIPVIIVTSLSEKESRIEGLEAGASDFLSKPIDEAEFRVRVKNLLKIKRYETYLLEHGKKLEGEVKDKSEQLKSAFEKIRHGYAETVYRLNLAAEYRDRETGGHIKRISLYSQLLARRMGFDENFAEMIFFASPMHDVGKIGIPDSILLKHGRHSEQEKEVMRRHTLIGAEILGNSDSEILQAARDIALSHHECWDGSGYPQGLKGTEIPVAARLVHIVDIYDALRSRRPYKPPYTHEEACAIMKDERSGFDPVVYNAFNECSADFKRLFDENQHGPEGERVFLIPGGML